MRPEDWPERLADYLRATQERPFEWGKHDCCIFAADWVLMLTGVDPMALWRGEYHTATGARRLAHQHGGLEAMVTAALGAPIVPAFAQRGDVVLAEQALGPTLGIRQLTDSVFPGLLRLEWMPVERDEVAWRVGE